jgi:hypothetical protein
MINQKIVCLLLVQLVLAINVYSQSRGGNAKFSAEVNPYEEIIQDTATGKRTAKFLMNFKQPVDGLAALIQKGSQFLAYYPTNESIIITIKKNLNNSK